MMSEKTQKQFSLTRQFDKTSLQCWVIGESLQITLVKEANRYTCKFTNQSMHAQIKQMFSNVLNFFQYVHSTCQEWAAGKHSINITSQHQIQIALPAIHQGKIKKINLKTKPEPTASITPKIDSSSQNESTFQDISQDITKYISNIHDFKSTKDCFMEMWSYLERQRQKRKQIEKENNQLKKMMKQMDCEMYKISHRNNQIIKNLNFISQLTNREFRTIQTFLKEIDRKNAQEKVKLNQEMEIIKSKALQTKSVIAEAIKENVNEFQNLKEQVKHFNNKIYIPPTKLVFKINRDNPYINRFRIQGHLITKTHSEQRSQLLSYEAVPETGKSYFMIKNVEIPNNYIHVGVIVEGRGEEEWSQLDEMCINYWGGNGCVNNCGNGRYIGREFKSGETMTVIIDMNEGVIKWIINDSEIANTQLGDLRKQKLLPYVELLYGGSKIELINS